jgi:hypothetical protein
MGSKAHEFEDIGRLSINQDEIRSEVAVAIANPFARKFMIVILTR